MWLISSQYIFTQEALSVTCWDKTTFLPLAFTNTPSADILIVSWRWAGPNLSPHFHCINTTRPGSVMALTTGSVWGLQEIGSYLVWLGKCPLPTYSAPHLWLRHSLLMCSTLQTDPRCPGSCACIVQRLMWPFFKKKCRVSLINFFTLCVQCNNITLSPYAIAIYVCIQQTLQ